MFLDWAKIFASQGRMLVTMTIPTAPMSISMASSQKYSCRVRAYFPAPRFWLMSGAAPSVKPTCHAVVRPPMLLEMPRAPTVNAPYMPDMELTMTFPAANSIFSADTG